MEKHLDLPAVPKFANNDDVKEPPAKRQKFGSDIKSEPTEDYSKDQKPFVKVSQSRYTACIIIGLNKLYSFLIGKNSSFSEIESISQCGERIEEYSLLFWEEIEYVSSCVVS